MNIEDYMRIWGTKRKKTNSSKNKTRNFPYSSNSASSLKHNLADDMNLEFVRHKLLAKS